MPQPSWFDVSRLRSDCCEQVTLVGVVLQQDEQQFRTASSSRVSKLGLSSDYDYDG